MINPRDFLATVSRSNQERLPQAGRTARLGTVDPSYTSGDPRVTFDGDQGMSPDGLPHLTSYTPSAGDRVVLLPVGNTYLVLGEVAS